MAEDAGFIPLDLGDFEQAVESTTPPKVPDGKYQLQLKTLEFVEASTGRTGLQAIVVIVEHDDPKINGKELRYNGWWGTGFLTNLLLAYAGADGWDAVRAELSDPDGLVRIRDNQSEVINNLIGNQAEGTVKLKKGDEWPSVTRFTVGK